MASQADLEEQQRARATSGGVLTLLIVIVLGIWAYNHLAHKTTWTAIYYPNATNTYSFQDKAVGSLQECQDWVHSIAQAAGNTGYDYECGTDCKVQYDASGKFYRCKDTLR